MIIVDSKSDNKRVVVIFLISLFCCTGLLFVGDSLIDNVRHQRMIRYAVASARETDGAPNLVVLNGEEGYVADTGIHLEHTNNGYIKISGTNKYEKSFWKKISTIKLKKGTYTLCGLKGLKKESVVLQLSVETGTSSFNYYNQHDMNVTFSVDHDRMAFLYIRVYPHAVVDTIARPAIYMEKDGAIERK